jgi:predicted PurR-regulated permease PerM
MAKNDNVSKNLFLFLLIAMIVVVFFILRPFLITIMASAILAYVFYPIYRWLNSKLKRKNLSAFITTIFVVIIIALPMIFAMNSLATEARVNYLLIKQKVIGGNLFGADCDTSSLVCRASNSIRDYLAEPQTKYYLDTAAQKTTQYIVDNVSSFLFSIPVILFNIFIMIFIMFYLFRDGLQMINKIEKLSPLRKPHYRKIMYKFDNVIYAVVFGHIIVSLVQGAVGALGLFFLGVSSPLSLGLVMALLAIIPIVGPPLVWLPIALVMILEGSSTGSNVLIIKGIILILYGIFIVGTIDNILKPKIIGDKAKVHPVMVLLGVVGGISMFGFIGIVIGPVILAVFMTFLQIYEEEKGVMLA